MSFHLRDAKLTRSPTELFHPRDPTNNMIYATLTAVACGFLAGTNMALPQQTVSPRIQMMATVT